MIFFFFFWKFCEVGIIYSSKKLSRLLYLGLEPSLIARVLFSLVQFISVAQSCLTLCNSMDCSTPGLPVHHQLLQLAQTHVHQVSDAILSLIFPSIRVFSNEAVLRIRWPKYWSCSINPQVNIQDWFPLGWTGWISLQPRDSQESSPTPQFKSINSSVLSFLYSPTLTSIHDYWKNHSLH